MRNKYPRIQVSAADVRTGAYKRHVGGGAERWDRRGAFQVFLLQRLGLTSAQAVLDIGCGALRAGRHFIEHLGPGAYAGVDANGDFIRTARAIVDADDRLRAKTPLLAHAAGFDVAGLAPRAFDFVLAFSVLNHCDSAARRRFFAEMPRVTAPDGRIVITHAAWFAPRWIAGAELAIDAVLGHPRDLAPDLDLSDWGWPSRSAVFPAVVLRLSGARPAE